jgi:hypothetical protein
MKKASRILQLFHIHYSSFQVSISITKVYFLNLTSSTLNIVSEVKKLKTNVMEIHKLPFLTRIYSGPSFTLYLFKMTAMQWFSLKIRVRIKLHRVPRQWFKPVT